MTKDVTRELLRDLIDERKSDMATISKMAGKNHSYIYQYLNRGSPRKLPEDVREAIETFFKKPNGYLTGRPVHRDDDNMQPPNRAPTKVRNLVGLSDRVPVYGYAAGSIDRVAINEGRIVEMRERGRALQDVQDGYYITVIGESMEPLMRAGDYLAVVPGMPPQKGRPCVVQFKSGEAVAKIFNKVDGTKAKVRQLNPEKTLEYELKEILSISAVKSIEW